MSRRFLAVTTAIFMISALFTGCSSKSDSSQSTDEAGTPPSSAAPATPSLEAKPIVRLGALQGPTGLGMVSLMEKNDNKETGNIYEITLSAAPDEVTGKIINGELDIAAVPTNTAAVLYNKTEGGVKIISVGTLGVLYLLQKTEGDAVESFSDLEGETIYSTGQGATQEYVLDYLLRQNGLTPGEDVTVSFKSEHAELATLVVEGSAEIALLPQPFVTTVQIKDETVQQVMDITQEWEKVTGGAQLTMGCIVVRTDFLEKNQRAVTAFLEDYRESIAYVNGNVEEAAALSGTYDVVAEEVARQAIPYCNIAYLDGADMKDSVSRYLEILHQANADSVGGELPDEEFYYLP